MKNAVAIFDNASMHHTYQDELSRAADVFGYLPPYIFALACSYMS